MTRISGDYGITVIEGPPPRPDKSPDEWQKQHQADRITYSRLLHEMAWTESGFQEAKTFGLPAPLGRTVGRGSMEAFWSKSQVLTWREQLRAFARRLK